MRVAVGVHASSDVRPPLLRCWSCLTSSMRRFRSGTLRSGSVDRPVMGASSAGSYEVTPPGRSRASDAAHRADRSTQRQQPTRQAYGESDPTGDATPILTGL